MSVLASFGQPQEGNRTKPSFSWPRWPFQQKAGTRRAHPCEMLGAGGRTQRPELPEVRGCNPGPGASVRSCSPQPDRPRSGALSRSQAETLCPSALLALYGAQRGGDTTGSGTQGSVGTAHPPCSLGSYQLHHGFQETTSSSSATYSQQACGMINAVNILK